MRKSKGIEIIGGMALYKMFAGLLPKRKKKYKKQFELVGLSNADVSSMEDRVGMLRLINNPDEMKKYKQKYGNTEAV